MTIWDAPTSSPTRIIVARESVADIGSWSRSNAATRSSRVKTLAPNCSRRSVRRIDAASPSHSDAPAPPDVPACAVTENGMTRTFADGAAASDNDIVHNSPAPNVTMDLQMCLIWLFKRRAV